MQKLDQKWPYLVQFGLNLGLNNLKFNQEAISDQFDSNRLTQSDRLDQIKLTVKMAIFGPIWTQFRSKQLTIRPKSHF